MLCNIPWRTCKPCCALWASSIAGVQTCEAHGSKAFTMVLVSFLRKLPCVCASAVWAETSSTYQWRCQTSGLPVALRLASSQALMSPGQHDYWRTWLHVANPQDISSAAAVWHFMAVFLGPKNQGGVPSSHIDNCHVSRTLLHAFSQAITASASSARKCMRL